MGHSTLRNFHLPLPGPLRGRLREAAEREGVPATVLARLALEEGLRARERAALARELAAYVEAAKGSADDLDPALEAASIASWLATQERSR